MSRSLLAAATFLTLTAGLSAQAQQPVHKAVTPKHAGVYKMATGELQPANANERVGATVVIFNASELTNYYSVPGLDQEWLDEGSLLDRNAGNWEQMNGMEFVYCSTEADATQNSGTVTFAFYDDTIVCTGPSNGGNFALGGYLCAYDIVGLPLGDANGAIQCWIVTVDLQCGFECPPNLSFDWTTDNANTKLFGWSFIPRNDNTGPWLSKGGTQASGIDNSFVWFDQFGALVGCFWFGGTPFANFAMKMTGNEDNARAYNPSAPGAGDDLCLNIDMSGWPPIISFVLKNVNATEDYYLVVSLGTAELSLPTGTLLVDHTNMPVPPVAMPGGAVSVNAGGGMGLTVYFQAVCVPAGSGPPSPSNLPQRWSNGWCVSLL
ncbi:MAG: hypothetical protein DWQ01_04925 [Planctomycetota bacterium]|nr:MAG: hypothetical protein DWQ01_04925 [Planctomycetota bacterium]